MPKAFNPFQDIIDFHQKFGIDYTSVPRALPLDLSEFRSKFLEEEATEYMGAQERAYDITTAHPEDRDAADYSHQLEEALDGLVDLCYVAMGTARLHGFDFVEAWDRVHAANMQKIRTPSAQASKRGSTFDVIKPDGWEAPSHTDLVEVNDLGNAHLDRA